MRILDDNQLEQLLAKLRNLSPDTRDMIAPLVHHCKALGVRVKELEQAKEDSKQVDMLANSDLSLRMFSWFKAKQYKLIDTYCMIHKKQRSEVLEIANAFARNAGYPEIKEQ